ncbi:hypothetical protein K3495_g13538 [Podosphaera aphanis]|nr:hypothetical protein K3495_g13538 [Podosphaera aphanis]
MYAKPSKLAAAQYTKDLNNFEFTPGLTIMEAWNRLKDLRRKTVAAKPSAKGQYDNEALMLILISALPKTYQSTIDSLSINVELSVEDQLKHLENKEERLKLSPEEDERANAARRRPPPKRQNTSSDIEMGGTADVECYLCFGNHIVVNCKYLERAQKLVSGIRKIKKVLKEQTIFCDAVTYMEAE